MRFFLSTFLFIFIFSFNLVAQNSDYSESYFPDLHIPVKWFKEQLKATGVTQLEVQFNITRNKKLKDDGKSWYRVDSNANLLHFKELDAKGKFMRNVFFTYNDNKVVEIISLNKKGDTIFRRTQTYNSENYFTGFKAYNEKNELTYERKIEYASDTQMISHIELKKGKIVDVYKYYYYPNGERSETKLMKRNGKVKRVWSYACSEEGVKLKSKRDSAKICIDKIVDDNGLTTEVWQWKDEKGKQRKTVEVMNAANKEVVYKDYVGADEQKRYMSSKTYVSDTILVRHDYQRFNKGKLLWDIQKTYNKEGQVLMDNSKRYNRGKVKAEWHAEYTFDNQGLLIQYISKRDKPKGYSYSRTVKYSFQ